MSAPVIPGVPTDGLKPSDLLWASLLDKPLLFPPVAHSHGSGDLPGNIAFKDQANTFIADQVIRGDLQVTGNITINKPNNIHRLIFGSGGDCFIEQSSADMIFRQAGVGGSYVDYGPYGVNFRKNDTFTTTMKLTTDGNVGIGTTTPGRTLELASATDYTARLRIRGTPSQFWDIGVDYAYSAGELTFYNSSNIRSLVLNQAGGVEHWSPSGQVTTVGGGDIRANANLYIGSGAGAELILRTDAANVHALTLAANGRAVFARHIIAGAHTASSGMRLLQPNYDGNASADFVGGLVVERSSIAVGLAWGMYQDNTASWLSGWNYAAVRRTALLNGNDGLRFIATTPTTAAAGVVLPVQPVTVFSVDPVGNVTVSGRITASSATPIIRLDCVNYYAAQGIEWTSSSGGQPEAHIKHTVGSGDMHISSGRASGWGGAIHLIADTVTAMQIQETIIYVNVPLNTGFITASDLHAMSGTNYPASSYATYGTSIGFDGNLEHGWIQAVRLNVGEIRALQIQPLGGNVMIGSTYDSGSKLQVTGAITSTGTITGGTLIANDGAVYLKAAGALEWLFYTLGGNTSYIRDIQNSRMQTTFVGGASSAVAITTFHSNVVSDADVVAHRAGAGYGRAALESSWQGGRLKVGDAHYVWYSTFEHDQNYAKTVLHNEYEGTDIYGHWEFKNLASPGGARVTRFKIDGLGAITANGNIAMGEGGSANRFTMMGAGSPYRSVLENNYSSPRTFAITTGGGDVLVSSESAYTLITLGNPNTIGIKLDADTVTSTGDITVGTAKTLVFGSSNIAIAGSGNDMTISGHVTTLYGSWIGSAWVGGRSHGMTYGADGELELQAGGIKRVTIGTDYLTKFYNAAGTATATIDGTVGTITAAKYYLGSVDYFDCVSGGTSRWSTPYAGRFIFTQGQSAQSMQLALQTAEGKYGSITHYDVNNAKGRLLEIGADPSVAISIAPYNDELARFTSWNAIRQIELKAPVIVTGNLTATGAIESATALGITSPGLGTGNWWRLRADNGTACIIYSNNSGKGMSIDANSGLVTVESLTSLGNINASGDLILSSGSSGNATKYVKVAEPTTSGYGNHLVIQASSANTSGQGGSVYLVPGAGAGGPSAGTIYLGTANSWVGASVSGPLTVTNQGPNTGTALNIIAGSATGLAIYWDNLTPYTQYSLAEGRQSRFVNSSSYTFDSSIQAAASSTKGGLIATDGTTTIQIRVGWGGNYEDSGQIWHNGTPRQIFSSDGVATVGNLMIVGDFLVRPIDHGNSYMRFTGTGRRITEIVGWDEIRLGINGATNNVDITAAGASFIGTITSTQAAGLGRATLSADGGWGALALYYGANGLNMFVAPGGAIYHDASTDLIYRNGIGTVENARLSSIGDWTTRGYITSVIQMLSTDPTGSDLSSGQTRTIKNTSTGTTKVWLNDGGTFKSLTFV